MYLDLFLISFIICFITDVSGVTGYIKRALFRFIYGPIPYREYSLKLLECSLCQTWWTGLCYLLLTGNINIPSIAYVALLSALSENITGVIYSLKALIGYVTNKANQL